VHVPDLVKDVIANGAMPVPARHITVLGSFPIYEELGQQIGAKYLDVNPGIWGKLSADSRWALNRDFLDNAIKMGNDFVLSNNGLKAAEGTTFYKEIQYMLSKGYKLSPDGLRLIR
jgi:hypothetical protein